MRMDRKTNLHRVDLVFCESVESRASRGKMLGRTSVVLLVVVRKCLVFKSLKEGLNTVLLRPRAPRTHEFEQGLASMRPFSC